MPSTKTKKVRKPAAKTKAKAKGAAKKRAPRAASRKRVKKAEIDMEPRLNVTYLTQLPVPPEPEPLDTHSVAGTADEPVSAPSEGGQAEEPDTTHMADEVEPMVSQNSLSTLRSRLSFYLGVVTGAAVLHVLVFAVAAIVLS